MNTYAASVFASVLLSGAVVHGGHALAADAAPTPVDAQALQRKLMTECMAKQRSQNDVARPEETKKLCAVRVKTQLQQLKDAGAMPPASSR
jgi:hypothetical protein